MKTLEELWLLIYEEATDDCYVFEMRDALLGDGTKYDVNIPKTQFTQSFEIGEMIYMLITSDGEDVEATYYRLPSIALTDSDLQEIDILAENYGKLFK